MVKPEWGTKRSCQGCGASFYDMRRDPIVCPKCGAEFDPLAQIRPQRSRPAARLAAAATARAEPIVDDLRSVPEKLGPEENEDAADVNTGDKDGEAAIEDVSELGEDKDDMFEVLNNVKEGKDERD